jgi:hypothetical protein
VLSLFRFFGFSDMRGVETASNGPRKLQTVCFSWSPMWRSRTSLHKLKAMVHGLIALGRVPWKRAEACTPKHLRARKTTLPLDAFAPCQPKFNMVYVTTVWMARTTFLFLCFFERTNSQGFGL